ncbi:MAG: YicC family protein [Myxococcales bacterium]|nr:YicC family protein [Myxococcales bacterium]
MRSMTGFGTGEAPLASSDPGASGKLTVEIRSVNHRYLDVRVRGPAELPDLAASVETLAREKLTRGRFDILVRVEGAALVAMELDVERARTVMVALGKLRDELAPGAELPLSLLGSVPQLFVPSLERHAEAAKECVADAFDAALGSLDAMRQREGDALRQDLLTRLAAVKGLAGALAERAPHSLEAYRKRLRERADKLRMTSDVELDAGRLEQEVAMFADRVDVTEELTRLAAHTEHFAALLAEEAPMGRKLDFLLQEMGREANTVGSKSQDLPSAHLVVELKAEIERLREQTQNVE